MSMMPMHDHERQPKRPMFCRHFKEVCCEGWVPSMGEDANHVRPLCNAWVSVFITKPEAPNKLVEVFDCLEKWTPDLLQQVAQETYQGAAASEGVRNRVAAQAMSIRRMGMAFQAMACKTGVTHADVKQIEAENAAEDAAEAKAVEEAARKELEHKKPGGWDNGCA